MTRLARSILATAALGAAAVAVVRVVIGRRGHPAAVFTDGPLPPVAPPRGREGTPADRGHSETIAVDVDRLRTRGEGGLEPVVQYLTYVQTQRGDEGGHLMFVRYADLDAMAEMEGVETRTFLERLDQLGVVVSNN